MSFDRHFTPHVLSIYMREIGIQLDYAHMFWNALAVEMSKEDRDVSVCFAAAQNVLTAAAQMSKLLRPNIDKRSWPKEKQAYTARRGVALRALLEPPEIIDRRSVRNAIEHYDERLDRFCMNDPSETFIDQAVTPPDAFWSGTRNAPHPIMRNLNPEDGTIAVLDDRISLNELMDAMELVAERAKKWLETREAGFMSPGVMAELQLLKPALDALRQWDADNEWAKPDETT